MRRDIPAAAVVVTEDGAREVGGRVRGDGAVVLDEVVSLRSGEFIQLTYTYMLDGD